MNIIEALILGVIQGITEFLPISSSGHLILFSTLFNGTAQPIAFDVALHFGTSLAILIFFWNDWMKMIKSFIKDFRENREALLNDPDKLSKDSRYLIYIFLTLIPVGIVAVLLEDTIDRYIRLPVYVSIMLIVGALLMLYADWYYKKQLKNNTTKSELGFKDAIIVSLSQILALIPGTSRSGITITFGMLRGIDPSEAARFSFLLATPLIVGAAILKLPDIIHSSPNDILYAFIGFIAALITGLFVIRWLLSFLKTHGLMVFIVYRFILGILILLLVL